MRYRREAASRYVPDGSHPVEDFEEGAAGGVGDLRVSSSALLGALPCPYCRNGVWAMCPNGHVHCCPAAPGVVRLTCPWCSRTSQYGEASFDVGRGRG